MKEWAFYFGETPQERIEVKAGSYSEALRKAKKKWAKANPPYVIEAHEI